MRRARENQCFPVKFQRPSILACFCAVYIAALLNTCVAVDPSVPAPTNLKATFYVPENSKLNREVFSLKSEIHDPLNRTLTYRLYQKDEYFSVERNGTTRLIRPLDRESFGPGGTNGEGDVFLKFTASVIDISGTAQNTVYYLTVTVQVHDENDNPPRFTSPRLFTLDVLSAHVGDTVGHLTAIDPDAKKNQEISFAFATARDRQIASAFSLNSVSGALTLKGPLPPPPVGSRDGNSGDSSTQTLQISFEVMVDDEIHSVKRTQVVELVYPPPSLDTQGGIEGTGSDGNQGRATPRTTTTANTIIITHPDPGQNIWSYMWSGEFLQLAVAVLVGVGIFLVGMVAGLCYMARLKRRQPQIMQQGHMQRVDYRRAQQGAYISRDNIGYYNSYPKQKDIYSKV